MITIKIDNKEYELDTEKALAQGVLKRKIVHRIGNKYENSLGGIYILSAIHERDGSFYPILIDTNDWHSYHWSGIAIANNENIISNALFTVISYGNGHLFSLIE